MLEMYCNRNRAIIRELNYLICNHFLECRSEILSAEQVFAYIRKTAVRERGDHGVDKQKPCFRIFECFYKL